MSAPTSPDRARRSTTTLAALLLLVGGSAILLASGGAAGQVPGCVQDAVDNTEVPEEIENGHVPFPPVPPAPAGGDDPVFLYTQYLSTLVDIYIGLFGQDKVEHAADCVRDQVPRVDHQEGNITISDFHVAENLTFEEPNTISATVTNKGNTPLFFEAQLKVRNETRDWMDPATDSGNVTHDTLYDFGEPLQRDESKTVTFEWDGTVPPKDAPQPQDENVPLEGNVGVRFQADAPGGNFSFAGSIDHEQVNTSREMIIHDVSFQPVPDPGEEKLAAGSSWQVGLTLVSNSTEPEVVDLEALDTRSVAEGWSVSFNENPVTLPAGDGQTRPVIATITAPDDAVAEEPGEVEIHAQSQFAPNSATAQATAPVKTPEIKQEGSILVDFSPEEDSVSGGPASETVTLDVHVQNVLNKNVTVEDFFLLPVDQPEAANDDDWYKQWSTPDSTDLGSGNQTTISTSLTVPPTALAGSYNWSIEVAAFGDDEDGENVCPSEDSCAAEGNFTLDVPQWHGVNIEKTDNFPEEIKPGKPTLLPMNLTNAGNGADDIELELVEAPEDWSLTGDAVYHLPTGQTNATCTDDIGCVSLETPSTAEAGLASFRIRAVSANASEETDTIDATVNVLPRAYPEIEVTTPCQDAQDTEDDVDCLVPIEAGANKQIHLTLHNRGNVEDTFNLSNETTVRPDTDEGDGKVWDLNNHTAEVTVGPGESAGATLVVDSPPSLTKDDAFEVELNLTASEDHQHPDEDEGEQRWRFEHTLLVQSGFPDLVVADHTVDPDPPYRDIDSEMTLTVENRGTSDTVPTDLRVTFEDRTGDSVEEVDVVETQIDGLDWTGENTTQNVTVLLPAGFSSLHVIAQADPGGNIEERDAEDKNNEFETELTLRRFDIRLSAPANFEVEPGETVSLEADRAFTIENAGQVAENITAELVSDPPWASVSWNGTLAAGSSRALTANFQVPHRPGVVAAKVTANLEHEDHATLNRTATTMLFVNDTHPPAILNHSAPDEAAAGMPTSFTARIEDATGVAKATVAITTPSGAIQEYEMDEDPDEEDLYRLDHVFQQPGTYEWYVHAVDDSADEHSADTADEPRTIEITPADGPQLSLVSPALGTPIQPGTWVTVGVSTEGDVALSSAAYERDGETHELDPGNPLEIDTTGWSDGEHELLVRAEDANGAVSQQSFAIAVDGTQPSLALEVQPAQPEPGDMVQVSAEADEPITSIRLRVDHADGSGEEHEMGLFDETYRTSFRAPTDKAIAGLTVIAEDEAGNTATTEHTIAGGEDLEQMDADGSEEDSRLLPLGTPVALASLLTAGLVAVWRRGRAS